LSSNPCGSAQTSSEHPRPSREPWDQEPLLCIKRKMARRAKHPVQKVTHARRCMQGHLFLGFRALQFVIVSLVTRPKAHASFPCPYPASHLRCRKRHPSTRHNPPPARQAQQITVAEHAWKRNLQPPLPCHAHVMVSYHGLCWRSPSHYGHAIRWKRIPPLRHPTLYPSYASAFPRLTQRRQCGARR